MKKGVVFVGMSGGVDSSVAAYLLQKQGYEVVGVFMRCYNIDGCAERDAEDARRVAGHLGISFYVWDFEEEYKRRVVEYMIEGYRRGETPNPDVMCNREVKFGLFFKKALRMGADFVATGHYVRKQESRIWNLESSGGTRARKPDSRFQISDSLYIAKDTSKDQSYFLWTLTQKQLARCLFPIGGYLKRDVRAIARKAGLPTADKKDSQGICFLGNVSIADFLGAYLPERKGAVVSPSGEVLGEHRGAHFYTIGQREGIFVDGARKQHRGQDARPLYVTAKDVTANTLTVAEREDAALTRKEVTLTEVNILDSRFQIPASGLPVMARVRYRQPLIPATLYVLSTKYYVLKFDSPVQFVAEGQSTVWYSAEEGNLPAGRQVLGGGVITASD